MDFSKVDLNKFSTIDSINRISIESTKQVNEISKHIAEQRKEENLYKQEVLNVLKKIESNTANLTEILSLIEYGNDKQNENFELIIEILSVAKSENKGAAESKFRTVMNKINETVTDIESMQKLIGLLTTVYNIYKSIPT